MSQSWHPTLTALRDKLCELISSERGIRIIVDDAGIPAERITLTGTSKEIWHGVLQEAHAQRAVERLLEVVCKEFPGQEEIRRVGDEYLHHNPTLVRSLSDLITELKPHPQVDPLQLGGCAADSVGKQLRADALGVASQELEKAAEALLRASRILLSLQTTVGNDRWIERTEYHQIIEKLQQNSFSNVVLLGSPGSGKSALLAKVGQFAVTKGITLFAVKSDSIPGWVDSADKFREYTELKIPVADCVLRVATQSPVIVLIDQLDALAELADLKSARLNILLDLIDELTNRPNVHILVSCRDFEFRQDSRLSRIDAQELRLELPAWEDVLIVLKEHGVNADWWPQDARDLLRVPQWLKLFLERLRGTTDQFVFTSHQQMLDDLWERLVLVPAGSTGRSNLLMDLAEWMAEAEELSIPLALLEERLNLVRVLIGSNILSTSEDGLSVSYCHQTLFEHARARAFVKRQGKLAAYVLQRQNALFVRPTLWHTLHYLRAVDPKRYHQEMALLWNDLTLRRHLRYLLIDFLGKIESPIPSDDEQAWLIGCLQDQRYRLRSLSAIAHNPAWFEILCRSYLPGLMGTPLAEASQVLGVLVGGVNFARKKCLDLIEHYWLSDPTKDSLTWSALCNLSKWDEQTVDFACQILRRTEMPDRTVMFLAAQVSASTPDLAPRLLGMALDAAICRLEAIPDPEPPPMPADATEIERMFPNTTFWRKQRFKQLLESQEAWYELPAIAEASPQAYIKIIWPVFLRILGELLIEQESRVNKFREDWCSIYYLDDPEQDHFRNPFVAAMEIALRGVALQAPSTFLSLLEEYGAFDSELVQRLFCRGLCGLAKTQAEACLRFLVEDSRRLMLGHYENLRAETKELIVAVLPHLSEPQRLQLEEAAHRWRYRRTVEAEPVSPEAEVYERGHRLQLLRCFPGEQLSAPTRQLVEEEATALPAYVQTPPKYHRGGFIGSPMSAEQMSAASDDEIIALFDLLVDRTDSEYPGDWTRGGSYQASQEFGRFAESHLDRALNLLPRFRPEDQEKPITALMRTLGKLKYPDDRVCPLILTLDQRGCKSEDFRDAAAWALLAAVKKPGGLPDAICDLLDRWRLGSWTHYSDPVRQSGEPPGNRPVSILWIPGSLRPIHPGCYLVLRAITFALLCREPPASEQWLEVLEDHLTRSETELTWRNLALWELGYLRLADKEPAARFLEMLFHRFPSTRDSDEGAHLLLQLGDYLAPQFLCAALESLRDGSWSKGPQAFGELVAVYYFRHPNDSWASAQIDAALDSAAVFNAAVSAIRLGIAFTAAQFWYDSECREAATGLLERLVPVADASVSTAIMRAFLHANSLMGDNATHRVLQAILNGPDDLYCGQSEFHFVEHLLDVFAQEREVVCGLCERLVRLRGKDLQHQLSGSHLVDIALRLQRSGEAQYRERGLELFESLLEHGTYDAVAALSQLDRRLNNIFAPPPPNRRRRSRRLGKDGK